MEHEEQSSEALERQYSENVRLSWLILGKLVPLLAEPVGIAVLHPSGGQGDCLSLVDSDGMPLVLLNRVSQAGLSNGALINDIWGIAAKKPSVLVNRIIKSGKLKQIELDEFEFGEIPNLKVGYSAQWVAELLNNPDIRVEWCWDDGLDGTGDYFGVKWSISKEFEIPQDWKQLPPMSRQAGPDAWLFALYKNGNPFALLNTKTFEIVAATDSTGDPLPAGPKLLGTNQQLDAAVPVVVSPKIPLDAQFELGFYVYALRNPLDDKVFYIGKGQGDRIIQHKIFADSNPDVESAKLSTIHEIQAAGLDVEHLFIRTAIETEAEAFAIEQALIDLMVANNQSLTNVVKGHHSSKVGLRSLSTFLAEVRREPLGIVNEPIVMFKVHNDWRPDISAEDLYRITRAFWGVGEETRNEARYAFALAHGVVRQVYRIFNWEQTSDPRFPGRWEFNGAPAPEMADHVGKTVATKKGEQSQFRIFLNGYPGSAS